MGQRYGNEGLIATYTGVRMILCDTNPAGAL